MTKATTQTSTKSPRARRTFGDLSLHQKTGWIIAIIFAAVSAIWVWAGVANVLEAVGTFGFGLSALSWTVFIGSIAAPIVTYVAAFGIGWKLPSWAKAVLFLLGLAVAMVIKADLESLLLGGL